MSCLRMYCTLCVDWPQVLNLVYNLAKNAECPPEIRDLALMAHIKILDSTGLTDRFQQRQTWLDLIVKELREIHSAAASESPSSTAPASSPVGDAKTNAPVPSFAPSNTAQHPLSEAAVDSAASHYWVLPALRQMRDILRLYPEGYSLSRPLDTSGREIQSAAVQPAAESSESSERERPNESASTSGTGVGGAPGSGSTVGLPSSAGPGSIGGGGLGSSSYSRTPTYRNELIELLVKQHGIFQLVVDNLCTYLEHSRRRDSPISRLELSTPIGENDSPEMLLLIAAHHHQIEERLAFLMYVHRTSCPLFISQAGF